MSDLPPRKRISSKTRIQVFEKDGGCCYLCGGKVGAGERWDLEHEIALELGGKDEFDNYRVAHVDCHKVKSKDDARLIAKGRRIRRKNGPVELRKVKKPIPSRPFSSPILNNKREWPKRKFGQ